MRDCCRKRLTAGTLIFLCLLSPNTFAWDAIGHKTVARIAWDNMQSQTRSRVVALLNAAPRDSDIYQLLPDESLPPEVRAREFFMAVSNWADIVRDEKFPERRATYNRPVWHYSDIFWEQTPAGPKERPDLKPPEENAIERLQFLTWRLGDNARSDAEQAIDIAWVLHLIGDIHQPLHCTARVTAEEPEGDQGGNLFKLEERRPGTYQLNLHAYWDGIVSRAVPRRENESDIDYVTRVAAQIQQQHPRTAFAANFHAGEFSVWLREGYGKTSTKLYPASLKRMELPSDEYLKGSWQVAEPSLALAGYRLAAALNELFGT